MFEARGWLYQFAFKTSGFDCLEADSSRDEALV